MQTIDEAKEDCRFVGERIEKMVAEGEGLTAKFEGTQLIRFKVDKDGDGVKVVGGEIGGGARIAGGGGLAQGDLGGGV